MTNCLAVLLLQSYDKDILKYILQMRQWAAERAVSDELLMAALPPPNKEDFVKRHLAPETVGEIKKSDGEWMGELLSYGFSKLLKVQVSMRKVHTTSLS